MVSPSIPDSSTLPELPIFRPEYKADPYPYYRDWAGRVPFWATLEGQPVVVATRFRDIQAIYRDHRHFSSVKPEGPGFEKFDFFNGLQDMVHTDPPMHSLLRSIVNPAFTPGAVARLTEEVQKLVNELLPAVEGGDWEVMSQLAHPLSIRTMLGLVLDVPQQHFGVFENLSKAMVTLADVPPGGQPPAEYREAWRDGQRYCLSIIEAHRRQPEHNVIGRVVAAFEAGTLSEDQVLVMLIGLFIGGLSTIATMIGTAFIQLVSRPEQYALLKADPGLAANAVEEVLRYDSAGLFNYKFAAEDTDFEGLEIPKATTVYLIHHGAGFDPEICDDPFTFDVRREPIKHLAFGFGIHLCLGASVARLVLRTVLSTCAARLPMLHFANAHQPIRYGGWLQERAPIEVPLRFIFR